MKFRSIPFLFYSNYHFRSNYLCSLHVNAQLSTMCSFTNQSLDQPSTYHQEFLQFHQHLDHHTNPHTTKKIFSWLGLDICQKLLEVLFCQFMLYWRQQQAFHPADHCCLINFWSKNIRFVYCQYMKREGLNENSKDLCSKC